MKIKNTLRDEIGGYCNNLTGLSEVLSSLRDQAQELYDSRSEKWQDGDNGSQLQSDIEELDGMAGEVQDLAERIDAFFDANE